VLLRCHSGDDGPPLSGTEGPPPRILVVDDSPLVRRTVERLLRGQGYRVDVAASGEEAFTRSLDAPFSLVVSDVTMGTLSGVQLCRLLRGDPATAAMPIVLLTAAGNARSRFWGRHAGADEYLSKDDMVSRLVPTVARLLRERPSPARPRPSDPPRQAPDPMRRLSDVLEQHLFQAVVASELRTLVNHLDCRDAFVEALAERMLDVAEYAYFVLRLEGPEGPTCSVHARGPWPAKPTQATFASLGITAIDAARLQVLCDAPTQEGDGRLASGELAMLPIEVGHTRLGELSIFGGTTRLGPDDRTTVALIASELGILVQSLFLMEETRQLARTDVLTGLANRRATMERLTHEITRSERTDRPVSVALCDLDCFKHVNDTFGHNVGDEVLRATARALGEHVRQVDLVGRWGGEEVLVVLPEAAETGGRVVAERLRASVAAMPSHPDGPLRVTVSIGVATSRKGDTASALVQRADEALYRAKARGRNRVETAPSADTAARITTPRPPAVSDGSGS
jgi:two-component system, cell cycle response regulator